MIKDFSQLKKNLKKDFLNCQIVKIAILSDSADQFLVQALRGFGFDRKLDIQIWSGGFNQIEQHIINPNSELYSFNPEFIILFLSSHKLLGKYNKLQVEKQSSLATDELDIISGYSSSLSKKSNAKIIFCNYTEIDDSVFGSYANKAESSFLFQIRKLNYELMQFALKNETIFLCDLSFIQNQFGKKIFFQSSVYTTTEMILSVDILPAVASRMIDIICSMKGQFSKCIILDLDNTIWGGVIGDDGLENIEIGNLGIGKSFTEFQWWLKKLKNRGIILTVCSKNNESIAKEPFEKHPDMILRLDDISVFIANWESKVDNIRNIQRLLNISFDSMIFLDDNPAERNFVIENIPDICVPELPEDPAEYLEFLYSLNLFETSVFSDIDFERTTQYKQEIERKTFQNSFTNEIDFLISLNMKAKVESFNAFNKPRVAQLSQRSNQFNLRTIRYSETEIDMIMKSDQYFTFSFSLKDKYGDHGLICVVILKKVDHAQLFIETWLMSCRVLKRGMENFVLNSIVEFVKLNNFNRLIGEYIPTPKNELVKNHFHDLGFKNDHDKWLLDTEKYQPRECHITLEK